MPVPRLLCVLLVAGLLGPSLYASAAVHRVSDLETLRRLCAEEANPGDIIEIQPGTYCLDVSHIPVLRSGRASH